MVCLDGMIYSRLTVTLLPPRPAVDLLRSSFVSRPGSCFSHLISCGDWDHQARSNAYMGSDWSNGTFHVVSLTPTPVYACFLQCACCVRVWLRWLLPSALTHILINHIMILKLLPAHPSKTCHISTLLYVDINHMYLIYAAAAASSMRPGVRVACVNR